MMTRFKKAMRDATPPVAWRGLKWLLQRSGLYESSPPPERDGSWYDAGFMGSPEYNCHYRESPYYFLWCVVVDRVMRARARSVLDIGCGPGQVAMFLRDRGLRSYVGVDLSVVAIEKARRLCPEFEFITANALDADVFTSVQYDTVISLEFLEHVTEELAVLRRLARGTRFLGTVPNFRHSSHVRHFSSCEEVAQRYNGLFESLSVDAYDAPSGRHRFFLLDGVKL